MASLYCTSDGFVSLQFFHPVDHKRRTVHLGQLGQGKPAAMRQAAKFKVKIESIIGAIATGLEMAPETSAWLTALGDGMYSKLVKAELCLPRQSPGAVGLAAFIDRYIGGRPDVKKGTRFNLQVERDRLVKHFGAERSLDSITPADADSFLIAMRQQYAQATVGRTVRRAQQFFRHAIRAKLLTENPFDGIKAPQQTNRERIFYVTLEMAEKVLDACPDAEWRLIFALCRFAGLRCPSELLGTTESSAESPGLNWDDIDWGRDRFLVHSPKTEHHEGGAERWVPIFPELRPHLDAAWDQAAERTGPIIRRYRCEANLRTQLGRIIKRAGLKVEFERAGLKVTGDRPVWPRMFHNLRASCEMDLMQTHPVHCVTEWLGHQALIAAKHYLRVTEADFDRAAGNTAARASHRTSHQASRPGDAPGRQESPEETESLDRGDVRRLVAVGGDSGLASQLLEKLPGQDGNTGSNASVLPRAPQPDKSQDESASNRQEPPGAASIIAALPRMTDEDLANVAKAVAEEAERRQGG